MEDFFELFFHFFPSAGATIGRPAPVDKGGCSHDMRHHATRARALNTCWLSSHTSQLRLLKLKMNKVPICCGNLHATYMACAIRKVVAVSSRPSGASYCLYGEYWLIRRCAVPFYTFSDPP